MALLNPFSRPVCILGLGLIGGSLLRDLTALEHRVYGYNRSRSSARTAQEEGFDASADLAATLQRAAADDALIVLAVPMPGIPKLLDAINEHAPHCGFTDVVSVKAEILAEVRARGMEERYVGGHPMAGTSYSGWKASQENLFKRAPWVVTFDQAMDKDHPAPDSWITLWTDVALMASKVGAEVIPARAAHHDAAVARVSHLPHLFAETLAIVGDMGGALSLSLAAGSFRDGTRVAGTSPSLVRAMCETNSEALVKALDEALELLQDARDQLSHESPNIEELADAGYRSRIRYEARSGNDHRADSVSPTKVSSRPILRVHPGDRFWTNTLVQAESVGAHVEVF